ncbi:MAG TPA: hypothetical protein VF331_00095 [Polyangiales bacterium]
MFSTIRSTLTAPAFIAIALSTCVPAYAQEAQVPQTASQHEARAQSYKSEAAGYRKSAEEHKRMAAAYAKLHPDFKGGVKNPWNEKMAKHCELLAKDFDQLANDAEKASEFHTLRARELKEQETAVATSAEKRAH